MTDARALMRQQARQQRRALTARERDRATTAINSRALALLDASIQRIAAYMAVASELSVAPLIDALLADKRQLYLPKIAADRSLAFARWRGDFRHLQPNAFGILEPMSAASECVNASGLDAIVVPLVAFDSRCQRLGSGAGFYDRALHHRLHSEGAPMLIGCAFDCQHVDVIPSAPWDVALDVVVTETQILRRSAAWPTG